MAERGGNPREKLQESYDDKAKAEAENKRIQGLVDAIPTAGKGALTFQEVDKFLDANPDAQYFRIDNGGNTVKSARSYNTSFGRWDDNSAAIVGQDSDKSSRDIFRYANISAATPRTGKRGEKATIAAQYEPSSFFKDNNAAYKTDYGMVYSRDEYGKLKEFAAEKGKADRFLEAAVQKPVFSSDYGKENNSTILTGKADTRRAALGTETTDAMSSASTDEETKTKRSLLG